jgi:hypothetical protein
MSILKKLFSKSAAEKEAQRQLLNRAPRVKVTPLHRILFRLVGNEHSEELKIGNVSIGGMAIIHDNYGGFTKDGTIAGLLVVDQNEINIEARIRHLTQNIAGCEFVGQNLKLKRSIEQYLKVEILALSLSKVSEAYLKPDPRGKTLWLTDGRQNELFAVFDGEGIVAYHLSFLGNYVDGGRGLPPRVGNMRDQVSELPGHKGSTLVDLASPQVSREAIALARVFVLNVDGAPKNLRDDLINLLVTN